MLHNPVYVEIFDAQDRIISPITRPISITYNLDAYRFNYLAVQMETHDPLGNELYQRFIDGELLQYRITGRFGTDTGDINSVYKYKEDGTGELALYGRCHKELMSQVLAFPTPTQDVPQGQTEERKVYSGSELAVVRGVLADNLRDRLGVPITFQSGNVGETIEVEFRFDEIYQHLYEDSKDRGGALLMENGTAVFDIKRNFEAHRFELTARKQVHHDIPLTDRSGVITRYQATVDRGEANRLIVGGPGEMLDRLFVDLPYRYDPEYKNGAGARAAARALEYRSLEDAHKAAMEQARDDNKSEKERQQLEKAHETALNNKRKQMFNEITSASSNKPAVVHPARRFPAEMFYENTSPDTNVENPRYDQQYTAMREAGKKKLEDVGRKGAMAFTIQEGEEIYLGPGGAFEMGDWVKIEADGVDFGEVQIAKAVISLTREDGYKVTLSDTEINETAADKQVDKIIRAMRELTNVTRRR